MQISPKGETSKPLNAIGAPQVSLELPIFSSSIIPSDIIRLLAAQSLVNHARAM